MTNKPSSQEVPESVAAYGKGLMDWDFRRARMLQDGRWFVLSVVLILVAQVVLRTWNSQSLTYYQDDWSAAYGSMNADAGWFFDSYNGYWAPLGRALIWAVVAIDPFNYTLASVAVTLCYLLASIAALLLLVRYFGRGMLSVLLFSLFALSPIFIVANAWWTVGITVAPAIGLSALAWWCQLQHIDGKRWAVPLGSVSLLVALFLTPKSVIFIGFLVAWLVLVDQEKVGGFTDRIRASGTWGICLTVLLVGYAAGYYWALPGEVAGAEATYFDSMLEFVRTSFTNVFAPGFVGGPWGAEPSPFPSFVAMSLAEFVALGAVIAAFAAVLLRGVTKAMLVIVVPLVAMFAANVYLVSGRGGSSLFGELVLRQGRYWADLLLPCLVVAGLLWRRSTERLELLPTEVDQARPLTRQTREVLFGVLLVGSLTSIWLGWNSVTTTMREYSGGTWLANAAKGLQDTPGVAVFDRSMPAVLIDPYLFPEFGSVSGGLKYWVNGQRFDVPASEYYVIDDTGDLAKARLASSSQSVPGPVPGCGYAIQQLPTAIPVTPAAYAWTWMIQVNYLASERTELLMSASGGVQQSIVVERGQGQVYFKHVGEVTDVFLRTTNANTGLCVDSVGVGNLVVDGEA